MEWMQRWLSGFCRNTYTVWLTVYRCICSNRLGLYGKNQIAFGTVQKLADQTLFGTVWRGERSGVDSLFFLLITVNNLGCSWLLQIMCYNSAKKTVFCPSAQKMYSLKLALIPLKPGFAPYKVFAISWLPFCKRSFRPGNQMWWLY